MLPRPRLVGHVLAFFEIGTGAKGSISRAGHHQATDITRVEVQRFKQRHNLSAKLGIHRVCYGGPIEGHERDVLFRLGDAQRGKV